MSSLLVTCPACGFKTLTTHRLCIHCDAVLGDLAHPEPWAGEDVEPREELRAAQTPAPVEAPEPAPESPLSDSPAAETDEVAEPRESETLGRRFRVSDHKTKKPEDTVWPPRSRAVSRRKSVLPSRKRPVETGRDDRKPAKSPIKRGHCPRGHGALTTATVVGRNALYCRACKGLWLDHRAFRSFLVDQAKTVLADGTTPPSKASAPVTPTIRTPGPCPKCLEVMERRIYGDFSGVLIDLCPAHGVWLDDNELQAIMRFVATAGRGFAQQLISDQS